jgi:hypothetical protein
VSKRSPIYPKDKTGKVWLMISFCSEEEPCGSSTYDFCSPGWEYEQDEDWFDEEEAFGDDY